MRRARKNRIPQSEYDRILRLMRAHYDQHGRVPTVRELSAASQLPPSGVHKRLTVMAKCGMLRHEPGHRPAFYLPDSISHDFVLYCTDDAVPELACANKPIRARLTLDQAGLDAFNAALAAGKIVRLELQNVNHEGTQV